MYPLSVILLSKITLSKFYHFYNCFKFHNYFIPLFIFKNENENVIDGNELLLETKGLILFIL